MRCQECAARPHAAFNGNGELKAEAVEALAHAAVVTEKLAEARALGDHAAKLDELTGKVLERFSEVMSWRPSTKDKEWSQILNAQRDIGRTVLLTQLRADDNNLKRRKADGLSTLLDALKKAEKNHRGESPEALASYAVVTLEAELQASPGDQGTGDDPS